MNYRSLTVIGYVLGGVMTLLGLSILFGVIDLRRTADEGADLLNTMFGIVLLLYGVYRLATTHMRKMQQSSED